MRKLPLFVILFVALVGVSSANAASITNVQDWGGPSGDQTFTQPNVPAWTHTVNFAPSATAINSATLELKHKGNVGSSTFGELWALSTQGNFNLGNLSNSSIFLDFYTTQTFTLPGSLFPTVPATSWSLALKLVENTSGNDSITLDYATLTVNYTQGAAVTSTPEPATLTLLGTGVAAALWRRRRQQRQLGQ